MTKTLPTLSLIAALAATGSAHAKPKSTKVSRDDGSWAIVLVSKETRALATSALAEVGAGPSRYLVPAKGFPKVVASDSVPGFRAGYHVVVLGFCAEKATAERASAWAKLSAPETYFKRVHQQYPEACPSFPGVTPRLALPSELRGSTEPDASGLRIDVVASASRATMECEVRDLAVQLRRGAVLLDERVYVGSCAGACTAAEKKAGEEVLAQLLADIERGEASESQTDYNFTACIDFVSSLEKVFELRGGPVLLIGSERSGPHDIKGVDFQLVTPGCGRLAASEEGLRFDDGTYLGARGPYVAKERGAGLGRRSFEVHKQAESAAPLATVQFDEQTCRFRVQTAE